MPLIVERDFKRERHNSKVSSPLSFSPKLFVTKKPVFVEIDFRGRVPRKDALSSSPNTD